MRIHRVIYVLATGLVLQPVVAVAQTVCSQAYEKAQEERAKGKLHAAHSQLKLCVDRECPSFIREDCARWMGEVEAAIPSVVFAVRRDGVDQTKVDVTCDGKSLVRSLDGKAVALDPGPHSFSFSIPGFAPIEQKLLIREGEHNRIVDVEFKTPRASRDDAVVAEVSTKPGAEGVPSRRYLSYGLAGAGALGLAGFALFAALGHSQQGDLESSCSPNCQSSQVNSVKTKYVIADTCLGLGLVSLGVATYLYLTSRGAEPQADEAVPSTTVSFVPRSGGAGGVLQLSTAF